MPPAFYIIRLNKNSTFALLRSEEEMEETKTCPMSCCQVSCQCVDQNLVLKIIDKILDHSCHDVAKMPCKEKGQVVLTTGKHEVSIGTNHQPSKVFVAGVSSHQVCGAETDLFNAVVVPNGFVLVADVKGDSLTIDWMACCDDE